MVSSTFACPLCPRVSSHSVRVCVSWPDHGFYFSHPPHSSLRLPVPRTRAYASATAFQVVLWRVRYYLMLPRAVRGWAMLFAYAALLSAVYLGQSVAHRPDASGGSAHATLGGTQGNGEL